MPDKEMERLEKMDPKDMNFTELFYFFAVKHEEYKKKMEKDYPIHAKCYNEAFQKVCRRDRIKPHLEII